MKKFCRMMVALFAFSFIAGCTEQATKSAKESAESAKKAAEQAAESAKESAGQAAESAMEAVEQAKSLKVGDVDVGQSITSLFGDLTKTLSGITDAETAKQALPQIDEAATKLHGLDELMGKLPAEAKTAVRDMVKKGLDSLQPLLDKVMAIPGVRDVIEPKMNGIVDKLKQIAG